MSVKYGDAYVEFHGDFTNLNKQVASALKPLTGKFGTFGRAAEIGLAGITAGAAATGGALFDIGSQFHGAYSQIQTDTGKSGKKLDELRASFKTVLGNSPAAFGDVSTVISDLNIRLGLTGKPLDNLSKNLLSFSRLTKTDVSTNVESISRLFNNWHISTSKQVPTLNQLFRLTQVTGVSLSALSGIMSQFGGPLRQLGFGFDKSAALIGMLDKQGVSVTRVMPALISAMKVFAKAGIEPAQGLRETIKEIEHLGKGSQSTELAVKVFGARAGPYLAAAIEEGRFHLGKLLDTMEHGHNTIEKTSKDTETFHERLDELKNKAFLLLEPVATKVFKTLNDGLGELMKVNFTKLWGETAKVREGFADFGAVVIPVISGFTHLAWEVAKVTFAFAESRVGMTLLGAVAGALLGRMVALGVGFAVGKVVQFVTGIREMIATFGVLKAVYIAQTGVTDASTLSVLKYAAAQRIAEGASKGLQAIMATSAWGALIVGAGLVAGALLGMSVNSDKAKTSANDLTEALRNEADAIKGLRETDIESSQRHANVASAGVSVEQARARKYEVVSQLTKQNKEATKKGEKPVDIHKTTEYKAANVDLTQALLQQKRAVRELGDFEGERVRKQQEERGTATKAQSEGKERIATIKREIAATKKLIEEERWASKYKVLADGRSKQQVTEALTAAVEKLAQQEGSLHNTQSKVEGINAQATKMEHLESVLGGLKKGTSAYRETAKKLVHAQTELSNTLDGVPPKATRAKGALSGLATQSHKTGVQFGLVSGNIGEMGSALSKVGEYASSEFNSLLKAFGAKEIKISVKPFKAATKLFSPFQRGGQITEGAPSGDTVPIMAERGEYMLNREAVKKIGRGALDRINFGVARRFQSGGLITAISEMNKVDKHHWPYKWGGGHDPKFTPPYDCSGAWSDVLHKMGILPAPLTSGQMMGLGKPGPGPLMILANMGHVYGAALGKFWGTSNSNPGGGAGWFDGGIRPGFAIRHFDGLGSLLAGMDVKGGTPQMDQMVSGAAAKLRRAADSFLGKMGAGASGSAGSGSDTVTGDGSQLMREISKQRGWNFADWWAVDGIETGHGANENNPTSSARLRGQFLDFNWGKYGPGSDPRQHPSMAEQIQSMADYMAERYNGPEGALKSEHERGFYKSGGLIENIKRAVGSLAGKHPKREQKVLSGLIKKISGIGIGAQLKKQLSELELQSSMFGERAELAGQLNVAAEPEVPASGAHTSRGLNVGATAAIPEVPEVQGRFMNETQTEWLQQQLQALFNWRNTMLAARKVVNEKIKQVARAIAAAQKKLAEVMTKMAEQLKLKEAYQEDLKKLATEAAKTREQLAAQLVAARKTTTTETVTTAPGLLGRLEKPKVTKTTIKNTGLVERIQDQIRALTGSKREESDKLKARIQKIAQELKEETGQRDGLKTKILPALTKQKGGLTEDDKSYVSNLDTVQGAGAPESLFAALPGIGVFGGSIFAAQKQLQELLAPKKAVTAEPISEAESESPAEQLTQQLLNEANERAAVANSQFDVLRNLPPFGGVFHQGGIVPGPKGAERLILAQSGERVSREDQERLTLLLHGDLVTSHPDPVQLMLGDKRFDVAVQKANRKALKQGRSSGRAGVLR